MWRLSQACDRCDRFELVRAVRFVVRADPPLARAVSPPALSLPAVSLRAVSLRAVSLRAVS
jgi:hypothetical protein